MSERPRRPFVDVQVDQTTWVEEEMASTSWGERTCLDTSWASESVVVEGDSPRGETRLGGEGRRSKKRRVERSEATSCEDRDTHSSVRELERVTLPTVETIHVLISHILS